jgi:hypothetical protein
MAGEDGSALAVARALPVDRDYMRDVVERLSRIGSSPLGFRVTGTPEDRETAELVAGELRALGLADVAVEQVRVDGWRFESAEVEPHGGPVYEAVSWAGTRPTPPEGVRGRLVDVGTAERERLDREDLAGAIALVDWRGRAAWPGDIGLELGLRGAAGIVLSSPAGGQYFQSERAVGVFGAAAHPEGPPMVVVRKEDAAALRDVEAVRITLRAELLEDAPGFNALGYLEGESAAGPLVVGAHHDGWFRAAFDNATGVAAVLGLARALAAAGHRPRHRICFTSRTAEEYGGNGAFDGLDGAWEQVSELHPDWGEAVPFHLCVEATGHPALRLLVSVPVELRRWARAACRTGEREGWIPGRWYLGPPVTGTEEWPFVVSGVPTAAVYTWDKSFMRTDYHTPFDTPEIVDYDHLARLTRLYAFMLLQADEDPDAILDHGARARHLAREAAKHGAAADGLAAAARRQGERRGRRAFTRAGRGLHAVTAHGTGYPHAQAAADVKNLEAALEALAQDDRRRAIRRVAAVGANRLARYLSEEAFRLRSERWRPRPGAPSWGRHLTESPCLWHELASLRGEPGARPAGPWIDESLRGHLAASRAELERRLAAMASTLDAGGG